MPLIGLELAKRRNIPNTLYEIQPHYHSNLCSLSSIKFFEKIAHFFIKNYCPISIQYSNKKKQIPIRIFWWYETFSARARLTLDCYF